MEIRKPAESELRELSRLFDSYRVFYGQPSDPQAAFSFLKERFENGESVLFIVFVSGTMAGFTQLYPSYSSVGLQRIYVLNDLFVHPDHRKKGLGEALLRRAQGFCREVQARGLALETARDNPAQRLYERLGWKTDTGVFHYFWKVPPEEVAEPS